MSKKPLAETNRRVFEVLWVLLIFALFYVGTSSALMVYPWPALPSSAPTS